MITCDWELEVECVSNWLSVRVKTPRGSVWEMPSLADELCPLLEKHRTYRLLLELNEIDLLSSALIGQLLTLDKWIRAHDGEMRLCGLSPRNREVLRRCRLDSYLQTYYDRWEAIVPYF